MITSKQNPKIKYVRRLQSSRRFRYKEQVYVVEGTRWLAEAIRFEIGIDFILVTRQWLLREDNQELLRALSDKIYEVSDKVIAWASDLETSGGILAVISHTTPSLPDNPGLLLITDGITNPGNLGTILRSAWATGVDAVLLAPGCVDAHNPKVVRGSMGAHLHVPVKRSGWSEIASITSGLTCWIATAGDHNRYDRIDWRSPSALIIGGEASGAGAQAQALTDNRVSIPMKQSIESLNASVAAGIILAEVYRQRLDNSVIS